MKIKITLDDIRVLFVRAKEAGTLEKWAELAIEWMEDASEEIDRLNGLREKGNNAGGSFEDFVNLRLSLKQAEKLGEILSYCQDEGPSGEGWASNELEELRDIVDSVIEKMKEKKK